MATRSQQDPVPASPGTYVLIFEASAGRRVRIGSLGTIDLQPGFHAYVGSARGPGGLAARLAHHRRRARRPHWHIDYLRRHTALREVWFARGLAEREHRWAGILGSSPATTIPMERFGASDCRCRSHLFGFAARPRVSAFRAWLETTATPLDVARCPYRSL
ncbi:MAG TPA: GIY-YIG nuclease family protein [Acidobacteriota bacterium]|nr:GIY-YIG nuclease family protein [Acidobacteriota bacterium]